MSGLREPRPESPQIVPCLLVRLRACNRLNNIISWIKRLCYPLYITAFSCSIPAFVSYDNRDLFTINLVAKIPQFFLQPVKFLVILFIGNVSKLRRIDGITRTDN
jgi:hypothetical protein